MRGAAYRDRGCSAAAAGPVIQRGPWAKGALFLAALPALGGSLLVMQAAGASRLLIVQQIAVSAIAALCGWILARSGTSATVRSTAVRRYAVMVVAPFACALPMIAPFSDAPHRWIIVGGLRLYVAGLVLPVTVLTLSDAWCESLTRLAPAAGMPKASAAAVLVVMAALLSAHPDAAQVTALAGAMTVTLWRSWRRPILTAVTIVVLAVCTVLAWLQPDPLLPVPYVEGVLDVAAAAGWLAWLAAIACVAIPPLAFAWRASVTEEWSLLAPAAYYLIISLMAWRQLTPMPLLGFGAGPILGYFFLAGLAALNGEARERCGPDSLAARSVVHPR